MMVRQSSAAESGQPERHAVSRLERILRFLGVNRVLAEQVLGDLAEAYEADSGPSARPRYAFDLLRSAPHLGWSAVRDGGPMERARLFTCVAGFALLVTLGVVSVGMRKGPPVRLLAGFGGPADVVVVNNVRAAQLPVRLFDARGHSLSTSNVAYAVVSGGALKVSPQGLVTCSADADALVRASVGRLNATVGVHCRPVRKVDAPSWITLMVGGETKDLPFAAIGADGDSVSELRGALSMRDSTVATLSGSTIRPVHTGETEVVLTIGDFSTTIRVLVHERVKSFTGLRPDQRLVAIPVRLARGDTVRFELPAGVYWVKYLPRGAGAAPPTITADGACGPGDGMREYRIPAEEFSIYCPLDVRSSVTLAHGLVGAPVVEGTLAVERLPE